MLRKYYEIKKEINSWSFSRIHCIKTVDKCRKRYEINYIEKIADNDGTFWSNEKHIEQRVDHKNLRYITIKYYSHQRKHRCEIVKESKKYVNWIFMEQKQGIKIIIGCITTSTHRFRTRLRFKQYDVILTKNNLC